MEHCTDNRLRTLAALAIIRDGDEAAFLCDYMSDDDGNATDQLIGLYSIEEDAEFKMQQLIRQIVASERFSSIAEVHPAWILEKLVLEPPRVIGIILRFLPSKHVRYILKNLPPMLRVQVPNMVESFGVSAAVLDVIRHRFEQHFLPMRSTRDIEKFDFENLYYLKGDEIEEVIRDLGVTELAIALSGMPGKPLNVVYNRLNLKDAKHLQRKIKEMSDVSPGLFRQACYTVLEVEGKHLGPDKMLMRIGLAALASAVDEGYEKFIRLLQQKLEPSDGYLLKRYIEERRLRFSPQIAEERRKLALDAVAFLARGGRIEQSWSRFFPEIASFDVPEKGPVSIGMEDTATAQPLA